MNNPLVNAIKLFSLAVFILLLSVSCAQDKKGASIPANPDQEGNGDPRIAALIDGVQLDNPDYSQEMFLKASLIELNVMYTIGEGRGLIMGGGGYYDYDSILAEGSLPFIFVNRYSGEDVRNSSEYSPGDIYLSVDNNGGTPFLHFYQYLGEEDANYEPGKVPEGSRVSWAGNPDYMTDGKSMFWDMELTQDAVASHDPCLTRVSSTYNLPCDDDAPIKMYLLSRAMLDLMRQASAYYQSVFDSIDGYISVIGRKNPVAWINPYTGVPMTEVPWVKVPMYNRKGAVSGPDFELEYPEFTEPSEEPSPSDLAGNYSYILSPSPIADGENRAYVQFYFYLPDGSVGAFSAMGYGPLEQVERSKSLIDAASSGGWTPGT
jgi:hypothetical protein